MIYFETVLASGGFRGHVRSQENGKLIWWTEVYPRKATAEHAIGWLRRYAQTAPYYDRTRRVA